MSDEKIGLEFVVETAKAVSETKKLSGAITESTTAARGAGAEQKKLGQATAETKAIQKEAAEAVRRAKEALHEHQLTAQVFGAKSREAAESAKKLSAAQEEATKTSTAAAKALGSVAKEAQAAAAAEGDKLSPATKRAAAAIEVMGKEAQRAEGEIRKLELQVTKAGKELQSYEKFARGAGRGIGELAKAGAGDWATKQTSFLDKLTSFGPALLGAAGAVAGVAALAGKMGEASQRALQLEAASSALTISIDKARKSTGGLISDYNLMTAANSAMGLGVTENEEEFAALAQAATKLALKTGTDVTGAVGNLVTALGRGSTELLDNYGIVMKVADAQKIYAQQIGKTVEALTEDEKKSAFRVVALQKIKEAADASNVSLETGIARTAAYTAKWENFKDSIATGVTSALGRIVGAVDDVNDALTRTEDLLGNSGTLARMKGGAGALGVYDDPAKRNKDSMAWAQDQALPVYQESERDKRIRERMEKENEAWLDEQAYLQQQYGPQPPPKRGAKKKGKKQDEVSSDSDHGGRVFGGVAGIEDSEAIASQAVEGPRAAALAEEEAASEKRLLMLDREMEAMDAMGTAETQQVDLLLWSVDMENQAEQDRAALQDERLRREGALARWQAETAKTTEQREKAVTKLEEVEHRKRLLAIQRATAAEEREQQRKLKLFGTLNGAMQDLGGALIGAIEAQAEGEKGAVAKSVGVFAEGIRNKLILTALQETALGVAAAAGIVTAGLAPPHFIAAGVAAAGAAVAGGIAVGFNAAADNASGGSAGASIPSVGGGGSSSYPRPSSGSGSSSGSSGGDSDGVPTSYRDPDANAGKMAAMKANQGGVTNITIQAFGGTEEQVFTAIERGLRKTRQRAPGGAR